MDNVTAISLNSLHNSTENLEIVGVEYSPNTLKIRTLEHSTNTTYQVFCADVIGFRVLDERDLMEYWPTCSRQNGWLFEITQGGWLNQEHQRPGSYLSHMNPNAKEFLITGINECVSVISLVEPNIEIIRQA